MTKNYHDERKRVLFKQNRNSFDYFNSLKHLMLKFFEDSIFKKSEIANVKFICLLTISLVILFPIDIRSQDFLQPIQNPFGLVSTNELAIPEFVDIDNDGDLDLFVGEGEGLNSVQYFENIGSSSEPIFTNPVLNPFGIISFNQMFIPAFADLDNDGDFDLLIGDRFDGYGIMQYYQNIGSNSNPAFSTPVLNPFGLDSTNIYAFPDFIDLDADSDFDLLVGEYGGNMYYFENIGSNINPQYTSSIFNPFGLIPTNGIAHPEFCDLDNDGDFDLLVGEHEGVMKYYENIGSSTSPQFASPVINPFGLESTYGLANPDFVDLDADSDADLFVGDYNGALQYFENIDFTFISDQTHNQILNVFPNPFDSDIFIKTEAEIRSIAIEDINGVSVFLIFGQSKCLQLENLANGIYIIKISLNNNRIVTRRIVKINKN